LLLGSACSIQFSKTLSNVSAFLAAINIIQHSVSVCQRKFIRYFLTD